MSYQFLDAYGSVLTADSSIVSGVIQRPTINIASILTPLNITLTGSPSISGNVGASIIGTVPVTMAGSWTTSVVGGVSILGGNVGVNQLGAWTTSVVGAVSIVGGQVGVTQLGAWTTSVVGAVSVLGGTVGVTQVGTWATSVVGVLQIASIKGTYLEDAGHIHADAGLFVLGVRNDTVSSFASNNTDYTPFATDSAGRYLIKPFAAEEARVEGHNSVVSTSVTTVIAAAGTGLRNYITDLMIVNSGATTTALTLKDGAGSIMGFAIAPTNGGSNMVGLAIPFRTGANASFDIQPTSASSILYFTAKGYKAP